MAPARPWLILALAGGCLIPTACGAAASHSIPPRTLPTSSTVAAAPARPQPPHHRNRHHEPAPNPGTLPQTSQRPSSSTRPFGAEMAALWRAIRTDAPGAGRRAFFPEAAYVQVKAIADPRSDYRGRLLADYSLDIGAAHALLGAGAPRARLIAVEVPAAYAHWVPPGACYNRVGYYEVPNSRLLYRSGGAVRSLGIASMISWRGVWYVVHLGAVTRQAATGLVDDPSDGPGEPVPSSTC